MKTNRIISVVLIITIFITMLSLYPSKVMAVTQKKDSQINNIDDKKYPGIKSVAAAIIFKNATYWAWLITPAVQKSDDLWINVTSK